jgi:hypothetical protein
MTLYELFMILLGLLNVKDKLIELVKILMRHFFKKKK